MHQNFYVDCHGNISAHATTHVPTVFCPPNTSGEAFISVSSPPEQVVASASVRVPSVWKGRSALILLDDEKPPCQLLGLTADGKRLKEAGMFDAIADLCGGMLPLMATHLHQEAMEVMYKGTEMK